MDYNQALDYLNHLARFGSKLGLERMHDLLELLGRPDADLNVIHVAGTNGKGSVCAGLSSILRAAGRSVGLYTSPHLSRFNERIAIDGEPISNQDLARVLTEVRRAADVVAGQEESPTQFEVSTAAMLLYFREKRPDFVILEVGLGGRLDATNSVSRPLLTVITPVSLDHTEVLGPDLPSVAREKAGILKPGVPVVIGPQEPPALEVIERAAGELGCPALHVAEGAQGPDWAGFAPVDVGPHGGEFRYWDSLEGEDSLWRADGVKTSLLGRHQIPNAAVAVASARQLGRLGHVKITREHLRSGLKSCIWPGRLEVIGRSPRVIVDGAHNAAGASALAEALTEIWPKADLVLLFAAQGHKNWRDMLGPLAALSREVVVTRVPWGQSLDPEEAISWLGRGMACSDLEKAADMALETAGPNSTVLITGSLYLVGPARDLVLAGGDQP